MRFAELGIAFECGLIEAALTPKFRVVVVYATAGDYAAYTAKTAPDGIEASLARASERIDELLIGAMYATDEQDMPTDLKERDADHACDVRARRMDDRDWRPVRCGQRIQGHPDRFGAAGAGRWR
ncbi:hypothetical protein [Nonomuraea sp. JJY05]|uniref:hypothetical protein n=1 Tax=Nonomuraea sp. JJY05 TaxID=3350255 RepID=UPI00373EF1A4